MRIICCGSRAWYDEQRIRDRLELYGDQPIVIVHGGAVGADTICGEWAVKFSKQQEVHRPVYAPLLEDSVVGHAVNRQAPIERNRKMARLGADICLAFWDGQSGGTLSMIQLCVKAGIPVEITPMKRRAP